MEKVIRDPNQTEEQPGLAAGVVEAAKDLSVVAPRLLVLHRALSTGAAATQSREAQRLTRKYGADHPRVAAARARGAAYAGGGKHVSEGVTHLGKAIEPLFTQNIFSGFVVDRNGAAAVSHVVRLQERKKKDGDLTGRTGKDGSFRIALGGAKGTGRDPLKSLAANLAKLIPNGARTEEAAAKADSPDVKRASVKADAKPTAAADSKHRREYDVSILDPAGNVVHQEELPLPIDVGRSTFRYFVLPTANPKTPPPKPSPKPSPRPKPTKAR
jgi:hypothetical protein